MEYFRDTVIIRAPGTDVKKNMSESIISAQGAHFPYLLAFSDAGNYSLIGSKEAYIWSCLYRPQTISSLTDMFFKKYKVFARDFIIEVMDKWEQEGFVSSNGVSENRRGIKLKLVFNHFDKFLDPIYNLFGKALFVKERWIFLLGFAIFCLLVRAITRPNVPFADTSSPVTKILLLLVLALILGFLHEVAHAIVAKKYGVSVKKAGFKFMFGVPFFFVDLSEAWIRPKIERIAITIAGPLFNIIVAGLCCIPLILGLLPEASQTIREIVWLNIFAVVINLLPFHGLDGYFILEDLLGIPNLNTKAWRATLGREESNNRALLTAYSLFSIFVSVLLLVFTYRTWVGFFGIVTT